jgi:hypothetical protein
LTFLSLCSILGPVFMYARAAKTMNKLNPDEGKITNGALFHAMVVEVFCGYAQMLRILGLSRGSDSSQGSKEVDSHKKRPASSHTHKQVHRDESAPQHRDDKMIKFLSQALRMGFWLSFFLFIMLDGVAFLITTINTFDTREDFKMTALASMIQSVSFSAALYQILWFLNCSYRKGLQHYSRTGASAMDSKESKELPQSKDDSKVGELTATHHSKSAPEVGVVLVVANTQTD